MRAPKEIICDQGIHYTLKGPGDHKGSLEYSFRYSVEAHPDIVYDSGLLLTAKFVERDFTRLGRPDPSREIVKQGNWECVPASLAMMMNLPLEEVKKAFYSLGWENDESGTNDKEMIAAARLLGGDLYRNTEPADVEPCLLTVRSINFKDKAHMIYWDGKEMLDPNWGFEGRKWYGTEWGLETIRGSGFYSLLDRILSEAERKELDEHYNKMDKEKLEKARVAIAKQMIKNMEEAKAKVFKE